MSCPNWRRVLHVGVKDLYEVAGVVMECGLPVGGSVIEWEDLASDAGGVVLDVGVQEDLPDGELRDGSRKVGIIPDELSGPRFSHAKHAADLRACDHQRLHDHRIGGRSGTPLGYSLIRYSLIGSLLYRQRCTMLHRRTKPHVDASWHGATKHGQANSRKRTGRQATL